MVWLAGPISLHLALIAFWYQLRYQKVKAFINNTDNSTGTNMADMNTAITTLNLV